MPIPLVDYCHRSTVVVVVVVGNTFSRSFDARTWLLPRFVAVVVVDDGVTA